MVEKLLNGVMFQAVWVACVWGGATGRWWLGVVALTAFAGWQIPRSRNPVAELRLAGAAALLGFVVDSGWAATGLIAYTSPVPSTHLAPIWIVALWAGLALTLNHSMAWLAARPRLAALFGGVGGPFSFWIGAHWWHAAEFTAPTRLVLGVLSVAWGAVIPTLFLVARRLESAPAAAPGQVGPAVP